VVEHLSEPGDRQIVHAALPTFMTPDAATVTILHVTSSRGRVAIMDVVFEVVRANGAWRVASKGVSRIS
jgi:hypothetical protein